MTENCGFVYVATGEGYLKEALLSASSLRAVMPNASICLITDVTSPMPSGLFDTVRLETEVCRNPIDKLRSIDCPYERVIFLDTDTYVCGDLSELFDLLDRFDLALLQENHRGWDYTLAGVPSSFPEYNTGVIVFRRSAAVRSLFETWRKNYDELRQSQELRNDQPAFRQALYFSELRVATLPSEFHFLGNVPNYAMWEIRLVHGRGNLPKIAQLANESLGARAYVPAVGVMRSFLGRKIWLTSMVRFGWRALKIFLRPPVDTSLLNPGRWWK
jgi:hypothetical protein